MKKSLLLKKCAGRSLAVRRWHWAKDRVLMQLSKAKANEALISSLSRPTIEASLIYSGTKIFWQSRMKVDLYFYLHLPQNCIEVISFDTNLNRELNRLYLNYSAARECVRRDFVALSSLSIAEQFVSILASTDEANEYEEEKEEEDCKGSNYEEGKTIEKKKTAEQLPAAIMTEEVAQNKLSTFILSRLHVDKFIGSFLPEVTFEHREDDDHHQIDEINLSRDSSSCSLSSLVYSARPADVAPVSVTHRRWTSIDSFRQTSSAFMTDIQALQVACCKAEILTVALSESVDSFLETLDAPKMRASIKMSSTSSSSSSSGELCRPSIKRLTADIVRRS